MSHRAKGYGKISTLALNPVAKIDLASPVMSYVKSGAYVGKSRVQISSANFGSYCLLLVGPQGGVSKKMDCDIGGNVDND
jgi:hypothetical protein